MKRVFLFFLSLVLAEATLWAYETTTLKPLKSPDGRMEMRFELRDGKPYYSLYRDSKAVVKPSGMGSKPAWIFS